MTCIFVFYLLFVWLWYFIGQESLTFKLSGIDILLLLYGVYILLLCLFSWRELDREILYRLLSSIFLPGKGDTWNE